MFLKAHKLRSKRLVFKRLLKLCIDTSLRYKEINFFLFIYKNRLIVRTFSVSPSLFSYYKTQLFNARYFRAKYL